MKPPFWLEALIVLAIGAVVVAAPLLLRSAVPDLYAFPAHGDRNVSSGSTVSGGGLGESVEAGGLLIALVSRPDQPLVGLNDLEAVLTDAGGKPINDAKVAFDIDMTNMSHGLYVVDAPCTGNGHYAGRANFSMAGPWRIYVLVERADQAPIKARIAFRVGSE